MTMEEMAKPKKLSSIQDILPLSIIGLLQNNPENELNRALVLQRIKKPIPPEAKSYEQIKDWIETNIKSPAIKGDPKEAAISINVNYSSTTYGTCQYYERNRGSQLATLDNETLYDLVTEAMECGWNFTDLLNNVLQGVKNEADERWDTVSMDCISTDHDDHEEHDDSPTDQSLSISAENSVRAKQQLIAWLRVHKPGAFGV